MKLLFQDYFYVKIKMSYFFSIMKIFIKHYFFDCEFKKTKHCIRLSIKNLSHFLSPLFSFSLPIVFRTFTTTENALMSSLRVTIEKKMI